MKSAFAGTPNMVYNAVDTPDLSGVTDMSWMFGGANSFAGDLSACNVSGVTNMERLLWDASSFNSDLSSWDVSGVTNMDQMFRDASLFNSDLSSWDVSRVTNMSSMFYNATSFTADLSPWYITISHNILDEQNDSITISAQNNALRNQLNTPRYALVCGEGDNDNSLFTIDPDGVTLRAIDLSALAGTYSIRISANDPDFGSGDARAFTITAGTLSSPDNQTTKEMRLYPNPVSDHLLIDNPQGGDVLYRVYNLLGEQLATHRQSGLQHQLEVSNLVNGVYLLETTHGNQKGVFRFVKK